MNMVTDLIFPLVIAYVIGSVPFAFLLARLVLQVDVRTIGSGNVGATNALRTGNKLVALLTLILDLGKGYLAVTVLHYYYSNLPLLLLGLAAVVGHVFPIWLKFKGGKGVATTVGVTLGVSPVATVFLVVIWGGLFLWKRYASLASVITALLLPLFIYMFCSSEEIKYAIALMVLVVLCHFKNIQRLIEGNELKI